MVEDFSELQVVVVLYPNPGREAEVVSCINGELQEIRASTGCEEYVLYLRVDGVVVLLERWSNREAWQAHFELAAIRRLKEGLTPLLAKPAERWEMYAA